MKNPLIKFPKKILRHYFLMWERCLDIDGLCSREEYVWSILGLIINGLIYLSIVNLATQKLKSLSPLAYIITNTVIFSILFIPPGTLTLRRLGDGGNGTWWLWTLLLILLPNSIIFNFLKIATVLYVFYMLCQPSKSRTSLSAEDYNDVGNTKGE